MQVGQRFCESCGAPLRGGAAFCESCGAAVRAAAAPSVASAPAPAEAAAPTAIPSPRSRSLLSRLRWEIGLALIYGVLNGLVAPGDFVASLIAGAVVAFVVVGVIHLILKVMAAPFRRGTRATTPAVTHGHGPGRGFVVLVILLLLIGAGTTAGASFVYGDDFRLPRAPGIPKWEDVQAQVPFLLPPGKPKALEASEVDEVGTERPGGVASAQAQEEDRLRSQLAVTRLPITTVNVLAASDGSRVLTIGVDYAKLVSLGTGVDAGLNALVSIVNAKGVDVSGIGHVTMIVHDKAGSGLFGLAVPTSAVEQFRAGKLDERGLVRAVGVSVYNRLALAQAIREKLGQ